MVTISPLPGKPRGNLESYTFPTEAVVDEKKSWSLVIHNNGDADGKIYGAIGNLAGNPGDMIITWDGKDYAIPPGVAMNFTAERAVCERITYSKGEVRFPVAGHYTIRLIGGHIEDAERIIDTFVDVG